MQNLNQLQQIFSNGKDVLCDGCEFEGHNVDVLLYQDTDLESEVATVSYTDFEDIIYKYFEPSKHSTASEIYLENVTMISEIHNDLIELIKFKVNQLS